MTDPRNDPKATKLVINELRKLAKESKERIDKSLRLQKARQDTSEDEIFYGKCPAFLSRVLEEFNKNVSGMNQTFALYNEFMKCLKNGSEYLMIFN